MKKHLAHYRKGYGNAALAQILAKFSPRKKNRRFPGSISWLGRRKRLFSDSSKTKETLCF